LGYIILPVTIRPAIAGRVHRWELITIYIDECSCERS
jgi:hypothetical protein